MEQEATKPPNNPSPFRRIGRAAFKRIKAKGWFYWGTVIFLLVVGLKLGSWLEVQDFAIRPRYRIYQAVQESGPRQPFIQQTVVVPIGDDEYWKGELARRVPIKRDYLANLVSALKDANPRLIALDFDFRSQMPDGSIIESSDYADETCQLLQSIEQASKQQPIVLPETIHFADGFFVLESDIYDDVKFSSGKVHKGYIALPTDIRKIPLKRTMKDGQELDSFAAAIVRAVNPRALEPVERDKELPFFRYLPPEVFEKLSPSKILQKDPETFSKIEHKIVVVGAAWNARAYGRGGRVDTHFTPVGPLQGLYLHANYVEALLDNRTSKPYADWAVKVIEGVATLLVAVIFALLTSPLSRIIGVALTAAGLVIYGYLSLLILGLFYDFFVPVLLVALHAIYEWLHQALTHRH